MLSHQLRRYRAAAADATDVNFKQVSLLLHGDGTNGAQNNTFLDSSTNNFTVTRTGSPTQGTFTPFSQAAGYWSNYFPTASYLTVATNAAFTYGTGDFTMECWVYLTTTGAIQYIIDQRNSGTANAVIPAIYVSAANVLTYFVSNAAQITGTTALTVGAWYHVAVSRSGTTTKMFLNGTQEGSNYTDNNNYAASRVTINSNGATAGNYLVGYTSNVRLVKGTAVYTANFTPPTTPLTAITNTSLLTCQSNNFKDNSSNNFAFTVTGTPSVQPFSPFAPTTAYSTSVNGGSCYIPAGAAVTNYLSVANNTAFDFGSGDFTIEFWYNAVTNVANTGVLAKGWGLVGVLGPFLFYHTGTALQFYSSTGNASWDIVNGANVISSVTLGNWYHVAVTRQGSNFRTFANGVLISTTVSSATVASNTNPVTVNYHATQAQGGEFISDLRLVKGTALYTATFTPPTAPLTAVTNTQLLLSGTNAAIFDSAAKNDLQTASNAQISTAVTKFGTGSMKFNGTTDYLTLGANDYYSFGSGDLTIEGWVYLTAYNTSANPGDVGFFTNDNASGAGRNFRFMITGTSTSYTGLSWLQFYSSTQLNSSTQSFSFSLNTWYHIAVSKSSGSVRLFVNGTQIGSTVVFANTQVRATGSPQIGALNWVVGPEVRCLPGYIDDLRVTSGVARYTANFTPPTAPFPDK